MILIEPYDENKIDELVMNTLNLYFKIYWYNFKALIISLLILFTDFTKQTLIFSNFIRLIRQFKITPRCCFKT